MTHVSVDRSCNPHGACSECTFKIDVPKNLNLAFCIIRATDRVNDFNTTENYNSMIGMRRKTDHVGD